MINKRRITAVLAVLVCTTALGIFAFRTSSSKPETTATTIVKENDVNYGAQPVMQGEIEDCVKHYVSTIDLTGCISPDDVTEITARITKGVMNSISAEALTTEGQAQVRAIVADAVDSSVADLNAKISNGGGSSTNTSIVTEKLNSYIDETIVPRLTALIQINSNDIANLKKSLASLSTEYKQNKSQYDTAIAGVKQAMSSGTVSSQEVTELKKNMSVLEGALQNYKSDTATEATSLNNELTYAKTAVEALRSETLSGAEMEEKLATVKNDLLQIDENKLTELKASLLSQVQSNQKLSKQEQEALKTSIENLTVENSNSLIEMQKQLQELVSKSSTEQSEALNTAMSDLNKNMNDVYSKINQLENNVTSLSAKEISEMKETLTKQIEENAKLTAHQKEQLEQQIKEASISSSVDLEAVKQELENSINDKTQANSIAIQNAITERTDEDQKLKDGVANLGTTADGLQKQINDINSDLGDCSLEYRDDGFYAIYHKGEADEVAKKLDFAQ